MNNGYTIIQSSLILKMTFNKKPRYSGVLKFDRVDYFFLLSSLAPKGLSLAKSTRIGAPTKIDE